MKKFSIVFIINTLAIGCSVHITELQAQGIQGDSGAQPFDCRKDISRDIAALVNRAPVIWADFLVGTDGSADNYLASALQVRNVPRTADTDGLEYPSELELALTEHIQANPCYRAIGRSIRRGQDDVSGRNRATIQLQLPIANTEIIETEYIENSFRRNYLFRLSLSFELRDGTGKVVFANNHTESQMLACFWQGEESPRNPCRDKAGNGDPINPSVLWKSLINYSVDALLSNVSYGIVEWRNLLENRTGVYYDTRHHQEIELDGRQVRNTEQINIPYLFIQAPSPNVNLKQLFSALSERGYALDSANTLLLQDFYNVIFRSILDQKLRSAIESQKNTDLSRILLLNDTQNQAFQNALEIACAEQSHAYDREDCMAPVKLIEDLCELAANTTADARGDRCFKATLAYGNTQTLSGKDLRGTKEVRQAIQAAGYLHDAKSHGKLEPKHCFNDLAKKETPGLVGQSNNYLKAINAEENDDSFYLFEAADNVMEAQATCLVKHIVQTYQQIQSTHSK